MTEKIAWQGTLVSIQPRIRLTRSFDQWSHRYLGYTLRIQGTVGSDEREFRLVFAQTERTERPLSSEMVRPGCPASAAFTPARREFSVGNDGFRAVSAVETRKLSQLLPA